MSENPNEMSLKSGFYRNLILGLHRGNSLGVVSNAKPFLVLAIIECIENGDIIANCIKLNDTLVRTYKDLWLKYSCECVPTPISKPFFHMKSEPFYFLEFNELSENKDMTHTPSSKFLRENVEYAYLDDQLWELLQDSEVRSEYRRAIVDYYLKKD